MIISYQDIKTIICSPQKAPASRQHLLHKVAGASASQNNEGQVLVPAHLLHIRKRLAAISVVWEVDQLSQQTSSVSWHACTWKHTS